MAHKEKFWVRSLLCAMVFAVGMDLETSNLLTVNFEH